MKNYIISLSSIKSSLSTALNLKKQLEEFKMPVELFEGTRGDDAVNLMEAEGRKLHPWGIKGPTINILDDPRISGKFQRPGVKGCFYSHYNLWKKCVELNEPIIIWEDDILLTRNFIDVNWNDVLILALGHPTKSWKYNKYLESPEGIPSAVRYPNTSMPGCCGYAIKPHAAQKLLSVYSSTYLPADNAINQYHVTIQLHNYIMGRALVDTDGKISLTRSPIWKK